MPQRKYQIGGKRALRKLEDRQKAGAEGSGSVDDKDATDAEESEDDENERVPEAVVGMQVQSEDEESVDDVGGQGEGIDEEAMANGV